MAASQSPTRPLVARQLEAAVVIDWRLATTYTVLAVADLAVLAAVGWVIVRLLP